MKLYRLSIKSKSMFITPLQGDTIFGHVCWGIRLHEGTSVLQNFLKNELEEPTIAISNGFPNGYLPVPKVRPKTSSLSTVEDIARLKKSKKRRYMQAEYILEPGLREISAELLRDSGNDEPAIMSFSAIHNVINRISGTTEENSLYQIDESYLEKEDVWNIYISTSYDKEWLETHLHWAFENGYGADASTGKGWFEIISIEEIKSGKTGNRYMALGNFVPDTSDNMKNLNLYADVGTKYGKLGNLGMLGDTNPFKKPVILFTEGSTFDIDKERYWCGSIIRNIHKNPAYVQNTRVPVLPFTEENPV